MIEQKGVDVLLNALRVVRQTRDVELSLVYQNPHLETQYQQLGADLGIADRVRFVGFKSADELAELYRQADLFILPTYAEALPSVITEALMSGLPVVATRVAGIPEQVGPHGTLVAPGDVAGLAGAIAETLDALAAGSLDPAAVSAYATARFSVQTMVDKHLHRYERLARAGGMPVRRRALPPRECGDAGLPDDLRRAARRERVTLAMTHDEPTRDPAAPDAAPATSPDAGRVSRRDFSCRVAAIGLAAATAPIRS